MSEYVKCKTQLTSQKHLLAALKDLGIPFEHSREGITLSSPWGEMKAEIAIRRENVTGRLWGDIGFTWNPQTHRYELVGIVEDTRRAQVRELVNRVSQRHAYHQVLEEARRRGYALVREETQAGVIKLQLRAL